MKKIFYFILALLFVMCSKEEIEEITYDGNIRIRSESNSQEIKNSIPTNIKILNGSLTIFDTSEENHKIIIEKLNSIEKIRGNLLIFHNGDDILTNLKEVTGDVTINLTRVHLPKIEKIGSLILSTRNSNFKNIKNLKELGSLTIYGHSKIENFEGLENISSIRNLTIKDSEIISFQGLSSLEHINSIKISGTKLKNGFEGMENLKIITNFEIKYSDLPDFNGLNNLKEVVGNINIYENRISDYVGFENLTQIGGNLSIVKELTSSGRAEFYDYKSKSTNIFNKVISVKGDINIQKIDCESDLNIFKNLETVVGNIILFPNDADIIKHSTTINGFNKLKSINGNLAIIAPLSNELNCFEELKTIEGNLTINGYSLKNFDNFKENLIIKAFDFKPNKFYTYNYPYNNPSSFKPGYRIKILAQNIKTNNLCPFEQYLNSEFDLFSNLEDSKYYSNTNNEVILGLHYEKEINEIIKNCSN